MSVPETGYSYCREVCYTIVSQNDICCVGGVGLHVEVHESHVFKRKYNRGRLTAHEHVWIFGGICRETKEMFVQVVPDRSGATLWPIIQRKIAPGSIIISDSARVYDNLHDVRRGGYQHFQRQPQVNFRLIRTTQTYTLIRWNVRGSLIKGKLSGKLDDQQLEMYLGEYMYRRTYLNVSPTGTDGHWVNILCKLQEFGQKRHTPNFTLRLILNRCDKIE
ncbi:putative transposase-like protein [Orchesella cincta]|uniref:Putative transposase-like protein n=1 Tax=Orchesella cincta TaxID=48709 RepID=A0A1D2M8W4_ORCCI|nr:putative transposase-like protein [Orchesella cincta]